MSRQNPTLLFAAIWQAEVAPGGLRAADPAAGKSTNGGDTWTEITRNPGPLSGMLGNIGVAIAALTPIASTPLSRLMPEASSVGRRGATRDESQR